MGRARRAVTSSNRLRRSTSARTVMADDDTLDRALEAAQRLICEVRDLGPPEVHRYLAYLDKQGLLPAVVVVLAAMVPDGVPTSELLAWVDAPEVEPVGLGRLRRT